MQGSTSILSVSPYFQPDMLLLAWLSDHDPLITSNATNENHILYLQAAPENSAAMSVTQYRSDDATLYLGMPSVRIMLPGYQ